MRMISAVMLFLVWPITPLSAQDSEDETSAMLIRSLMEAQNKRIDTAANNLNRVETELKASIELLDNRVDEFRAVEEKTKDLEEKILEDASIRAKLKGALASFGELDKKVNGVSVSATQALASAKEAQSRAASTGWILTIVSSIVSFLVILISLFFSSRFVTLYSENQVTKALLERIEEELKQARSNTETS